MTVRQGEAQWRGTLKSGNGRLRLQSGAFEGAYSYPSRFENAVGTNPEELIAAACAGCFSMALAAILEKAGFVATEIRTVAKAHVGLTEAGPPLTRVHIGEAPDIGDADFQQHAEAAKKLCLVSRALAGVGAITLTATLKSLPAEQEK
jgi:osmotically inducible protein OsmC